MPCLLDESVKIIYKMVDLQCLSVYWNPSPEKFVSGTVAIVVLVKKFCLARFSNF